MGEVLTGAFKSRPLDTLTGANTGVQTPRSRRFTIFAWAVLAYNIAVILWGALVRATGSGAGCGGHWPLCNGEVLPTVTQIGTVIEFTHRIMSGVALAVVVAMIAWAFHAFPAKDPVRKWTAWSLTFIVTEALIGAALVLLGHVAANESAGRIYSLATHLINTFVLLASLALTAWWATPALSRQGASFRGGKPVGIVETAGAVLALVLVAIAGVITALGDTLFPSHTLREGIAQDFSSTANFLIRLRVIHPALAILTALWIGGIAWPQLKAGRSRILTVLSSLLVALAGAEVFAGAITIVLKAPVTMQLVHLLLADSLWITLILFIAACARTSPGVMPVTDSQFSGTIERTL